MVDTGNQLLVAHKPTIVRAFIHYPATTRHGSEDALSAELYMDGVCVSPPQQIHHAAPETGEGFRGTITLGTAGTLRPSPGPHRFEVRVHHKGRTVLQRSLKADFATPRRNLVVVTVPIHVRGLFRTRRPSDEALSHSHRFAEAVFPLSGIEVIPVAEPYVIRTGSCTGTAAKSRRLRTILAAELASQGVPRELQRRLALEREKGNVAVIVGIAPDIRGVFGGQTGENIRGFAVPFAGTCVIKADNHVEFTLAHELGHLMPLPLHDSYQHDAGRALGYAKVETARRAPTGLGQTSGNDAAGIFINEAMGGFNIAYGNTHFSALPRQAPVVSGSGATPHPRIRGFMGASGAMWATPAEYARLYASFVGQSASPNSPLTAGR